MTDLGMSFSEELNFLALLLLNMHVLRPPILFPLLTVFFPLWPRLLTKFLDSAQEDAIPWHECIEPCLSAMSTHINDQEVGRKNGSLGRKLMSTLEYVL